MRYFAISAFTAVTDTFSVATIMVQFAYKIPNAFTDALAFAIIVRQATETGILADSNVCGSFEVNNTKIRNGDAETSSDPTSTPLRCVLLCVLTCAHKHLQIKNRIADIDDAFP